jgi:hypothetical protein
MIFKDIMTCREYEQNGEKKKTWMKVGTMRTTDTGKSFIDLFMFPATTFFVFEPKPKDGQAHPKPATGQSGINPEDIAWDDKTA